MGEEETGSIERRTDIDGEDGEVNGGAEEAGEGTDST